MTDDTNWAREELDNFLHGDDPPTIAPDALYKIDPDPRVNLIALRDALAQQVLAEKLGIGFNMGAWEPISTSPVVGDWDDKTGKHCGTACCMGGWAAIMFGVHGETAVSYILGLDAGQTDALFFPPVCDAANGLSWKDLTIRQAVATLTHFIDTGEINWPKFL